MSIRTVTMGTAICIGLFTLGCSGSSFSFNLHPDHHPARARYIEVDHVCGHHCNNHYWNGSRVVVLNDHHHHSDCGHHWDGSHWITAARHHRSPVVHVCVRGCNHHYWNGQQLIELTSHNHSRGCGHEWNGHRWVSSGTFKAKVKRGHYKQPKKHKKGKHKRRGP